MDQPLPPIVSPDLNNPDTVTKLHQALEKAEHVRFLLKMAAPFVPADLMELHNAQLVECDLAISIVRKVLNNGA